MKKKNLAFALMVVAIGLNSCQKEAPVLNSTGPINATITLDQAKSYAEKIQFADGAKKVTSVKSVALGEYNNKMMEVEFEDKTELLLSASTNALPIIAYFEQPVDFNPEKMSKLQLEYFTGLSQYVDEAEPTKDSKQQWKEIKNGSYSLNFKQLEDNSNGTRSESATQSFQGYPPVMPQSYDQENGYNRFLPSGDGCQNVAAGCVPTALAMKATWGKQSKFLAAYNIKRFYDLFRNHEIRPSCETTWITADGMNRVFNDLANGYGPYSLQFTKYWDFGSKHMSYSDRLQLYNQFLKLRHNPKPVFAAGGDHAFVIDGFAFKYFGYYFFHIRYGWGNNGYDGWSNGGIPSKYQLMHFVLF